MPVSAGMAFQYLVFKSSKIILVFAISAKFS